MRFLRRQYIPDFFRINDPEAFAAFVKCNTAKNLIVKQYYLQITMKR